MRRRRRLQVAIAAGKEFLPDEVKADSPSRLARKLGVTRSEKKRISLLQRTSSDKRTPYTRIADRVLGSGRVQMERLIEVDNEMESEGVGMCPWMGQRFSVLREGVAEVDSDADEQWLGHDSLGRPVWEDVLDQQRKRLGWLLNEEDSPTFTAPQLPPLEQVLITPGDWPPVLPRNEAFTFRNFHVCRQNERSAHAVNEILEQPAGKLNPLVLSGESGCGKTVLMKTIIGLIRPNSGSAMFEENDLSQPNDKELTKQRMRFGFVLQAWALFHSMTVSQIGRASRRERV